MNTVQVARTPTWSMSIAVLALGSERDRAAVLEALELAIERAGGFVGPVRADQRQLSNLLDWFAVRRGAGR